MRQCPSRCAFHTPTLKSPPERNRISESAAFLLPRRVGQNRGCASRTPGTRPVQHDPASNFRIFPSVLLILIFVAVLCLVFLVCGSTGFFFVPFLHRLLHPFIFGIFYGLPILNRILRSSRSLSPT